VFGIAAAGVLVISIALDARRAAREPAVELPRFSGSSVVARLPSLLPEPRLPHTLRVTVVRDEAAASFYRSHATLDTIVRAWRDELVALGADVRVVGSGSLATQRGAHVLVIPSSPCMTIATREAIEAATSRGQGLIVTGLAGAYDAGCRWIGYGFLIGMTGATRAALLESPGTAYVVVPGGGPLSADVPPGARIELDPAAQVALRHRGRDAYYSDYSLQPRPAEGLPLVDGAIVRGIRGRARVVYWGFELNDVVPRAWNRAVVRLLVRNAAVWAGRLPLAWIEPWPHGRQAAAVFVQEVDDELTNARSALDSLRAAGVPGTYFMTARFARQQRRLTRQLAAAGEIGTYGESDRPVGGAPPAVQHANLRSAQRELSRLLGSPVAGLRPPAEQFDTATMAAWLAAGGSYLFGVNDARAAAPELLRVGDDTLVLVSRIGASDLVMAGAGAPRDTQRIAATFRIGLTQVRALGGLYPLGYPSRLIARRELVPTLARITRAVAADSTLWVATTRDIAAWWQARAALRVETQVRTGSIKVIVRNRGARTAYGAVARVALPAARPFVRASPALLSSESGVVRLALPAIPGGDTASFTLRFAPQTPARPSPARAAPPRMAAPKRPR
jgi:peptidoglycan/xylan/chitin deacetylase (PgdA/CDA1 family)